MLHINYRYTTFNNHIEFIIRYNDAILDVYIHIAFILKKSIFLSYTINIESSRKFAL